SARPKCGREVSEVRRTQLRPDPVLWVLRNVDGQRGKAEYEIANQPAADWVRRPASLSSLLSPPLLFRERKARCCERVGHSLEQPNANERSRRNAFKRYTGR